MGASNFWPFWRGIYVEWGHLEIESYDITEFIVYAIFPLFILIILSMTLTQSNRYKTRQIQKN